MKKNLKMKPKKILIILLVGLLFLLGSEKFFRITNEKSLLRPSNTLKIISNKAEDFFYAVGKYSIKIFYYFGHFIPEPVDVFNIIYYVLKIVLSPLQFLVGFYDFAIVEDENRLAISGLIGFVVISIVVVVYLLKKYGIDKKITDRLD